MNNRCDVDLLVVGQGLAGSAVAMRAVARNYRVFVIDQPSANRSSSVAAGLFNPITGKQMSKTWLANELFSSLNTYYREVERLTGRRFFYSMPVYRAFASVAEQNEWMGRSADDEFRDFISSIKTSPAFGDLVNDPYGGMSLKSSGYVDTLGYMDAVCRYLQGSGSYLQGEFDYSRLELRSDGVRYHHPDTDGHPGTMVAASRVVFCQGVGTRSNPWFESVPVRPLKGEFLTIQCEWQNPVILNRGVYLVPGTLENHWRVGATFDRADQLPESTARARHELTRKLDDLIRLPYVINGQQWGFRPTTPDRRPIVGAHPRYPSLIIFNGLGTKGVSLAPYFSEVLIRWLESKGTIRKEADVSRF